MTSTFVEQLVPPHWHPAGNDGTRILSLLPNANVPIAPFVAALSTKREPGIAAALVDRFGRLSPLVTAGGRVCTLVVGRHSQADLRSHAAELALRHLTIVYDAAAPDVVRAFDLRAETPARDRDGSAIGAVIARLPAIFQLGASWLLVGATPSPHFVSLPMSNAYSPIVTTLDHTPFTFRLDGAERPMSFIAREPTGNWDILGGDHTASCLFQPRLSELARGVLIGRYSRCDAPAGEWSQTLSRVHALLFSTAAGVYICDLASTFGIRHEGKGLTRLKHLEHGDVFYLGECRLTVI